MIHDFRQAIRSLLRRPGFSSAAVVTLALGVGANAAVFTAAWHLMLKPLPWPDADHLVQIWNTFRKSGAPNVVAPGNFGDFVREATSFEAIAASTYFNYSQNLTGDGEPEQLRLRAVVGDYFRVYGMRPLLGRTLEASDETTARRVVVLRETVWRTRFGADPQIVGRQIRLDGDSYDVVGVMPRTFDISARPMDGWVPFSIDRFPPDQRERRLGFFLAVVGRLRPGVSVEQARQEIATIADRASEKYPSSNAAIGATVRSMRDEIVGPVRSGLLMLTGAASLVLLIACANLSSLQLARGTERYREIAVRAALGASRLRLVRLVLAESVVVSAAAGYVGLFVGVWTVRSMAAIAPAAFGQSQAFSIDPVVMVSTLVVSVLSGFVFALLPAWRATRPAAPDALRGRAPGDRASARIRSLLVTAETALATTLLISAVLLLTSLAKVLRVDPGFDSTNVLAADVRLPPRYETRERQSQFFEQVFDRLHGIAGVQHACAMSSLPLETEGSMTYVPHGTVTLVGALPVTVTSECFDMLRIELVRGRLFARREPAPVAVVSASFAARAWPAADPIGQVIHVGIPDGTPLTVIGVVEDTRRVSLEARPYAQVYQLIDSTAFPVTTILVRSAGAPSAIIGVLRAAVRAADPLQPVANVRTLQAVIDSSPSQRRFYLILIAGFAAIAVALASVGVYGLLAQAISQRTAEIGIRIALGADRGHIVRLVTAGAFASTSIGVAIGLAGAWASARILRRFLFQVSPTEPAVYLVAAAVLLVAAATAAIVPARRAIRIDPIVAICAE